MSTERFQRRVIQLLVEIRDQVRQGNSGGRSMTDDRDAFVIREIDSLEDFLQFEFSLLDPEVQAKMMHDKWMNGQNEHEGEKGEICICVNNCTCMQIDQREHNSESSRCHLSQGFGRNGTFFKLCPRPNWRRRKSKVVMVNEYLLMYIYLK
ncbi:uncharacterized protein LOC111111647 isoform X1 [Crassostrea virginica]